MTTTHYDYAINEMFASALITNDYTTVTDSEYATLDQWIDDNEIRSGYWTIEDDQRETAKCEITGLLSVCITIRQYFRR